MTYKWIIKIKNSDNLREFPEILSSTRFRVSIWDVTKPNNTFIPKQKTVAPCTFVLFHAKVEEDRAHEHSSEARRILNTFILRWTEHQWSTMFKTAKLYNKLYHVFCLNVKRKV